MNRKRVVNKLQESLGNKPSLKVIFKFFTGYGNTRFKKKLRKKEQEKKWNHNGKKKITHITLYSAGNLGDNVLSECMRYLFERRYGRINWNLVSIQKTVDRNSIRSLNSSDMVLVGGHGVFIPDTNENNISGWEWPCSSEYYSKIKKPLAVFGVGYNYFHGQKRTKLFENNVNVLLKSSSFFGLRNRGSVNEVRSFTDEELSEKVVYQPCATMVSRYIFRNLPQKKETKKIAVNVALDRAKMRMVDNEEIILSQIADAMKKISKRGYEIHFIAHCDKEIRFIDYLDKADVHYHYHHATMWNTRKALEFYNEMDMVIGMRGHGIWIPFGVNCHILALGNQNKTKWFFDDINAPEWNISIMDDPKHLSGNIVRRFIDIHETNGEKTTERLLEAQKKLWDITCKNMNDIKNFL